MYIPDFLTNNSTEIIQTSITTIVLFLCRYLLRKVVKKTAIQSKLQNIRTILILKYVNILCFSVFIGVVCFIWGIHFKDLALLFSSFFAVLGVALFAQWSILSNITAGVILYFSFPFKIGDTIRIEDKDFNAEGVIEDIKAFHIHLRNEKKELITYPNNLMLQKGVTVLKLLKA